MPIAPQPFKFICKNCGFTKIVRPKSDVLNPLDFADTCPKCNAKMEHETLTGLSRLWADMTKR